jgi:hypothetical protein
MLFSFVGKLLLTTKNTPPPPKSAQGCSIKTDFPFGKDG